MKVKYQIFICFKIFTAVHFYNSKNYILYIVCVQAQSLSHVQLFCDPLDCSPPGSSAHGIFQANTGVGCHLLLQGIFPAQGLNLHLLHWQADSLLLSH